MKLSVGPHVHKIGVAEMQNLRWMYGHTRLDRIRNREAILSCWLGLTENEPNIIMNKSSTVNRNTSPMYK